MQKLMKHNISVPLSKVDAFLEALDKKTTPEESARIAGELIAAMRESKAQLQKGIDAKNLTVCVGKAAHVDPKDLQKFISGEIPRLTIYRSKKTNRHMPLYMKHTPSFYLANPPKPRADKRADTQRKPAKKRA